MIKLVLRVEWNETIRTRRDPFDTKKFSNLSPEILVEWIAPLELYPIVLATHIWGHLMADKCVIFFTDNAAVVDVINKQTSKHRSIMVLIMDLVSSCLRYNVLFHAKHIPGFYNTRADYISRSQVAKFKELSPDVDENPTTVPDNQLPKSWSLT